MLWGLPLWTSPTTTHVLCPGNAGSERGEWLTSHHGEVGTGDLGTLNGLPVTSLARTVADCLLTLPPLDALVVADAALHRGLERETLATALAGRRVRRGSARARAVLGIADDGAESPGESASRFVLLRGGLPAPTTQVPVRTRLGTYWADLGWHEWRLLVEYDGAVKYATRSDPRATRSGGTTPWSKPASGSSASPTAISVSCRVASRHSCPLLCSARYVHAAT